MSSDSSSHGSKPKLAPAHEWSDDCVSDKTEEGVVSAAISAEANFSGKC